MTRRIKNNIAKQSTLNIGQCTKYGFQMIAPSGVKETERASAQKYLPDLFIQFTDRLHEKRLI